MADDPQHQDPKPDPEPGPPADPPGDPDPEPPAPEPEPPAPEPDPEPDDQAARMDRLENTVNGLVDLVAGLAPKDDRPVKVPWTHRMGGRRDDHE